MKKILLIFVSFCLAAEMEIDGDLKVLGNLDAPGLGGMKPERIYSYHSLAQDDFQFIVPENKMWVLMSASTAGGGVDIYIDNMRASIISAGQQQTLIALSNSVVSNYNNSHNIMLFIYEYSISGSGTDQGMDYIVP